MLFINTLLIVIFFICAGLCYALVKPLWQTNLPHNAKYHVPLGILPFLLFVGANFIYEYESFTDNYALFEGFWSIPVTILLFSLPISIMFILSLISILPHFKRKDLSKHAKIGFITCLVLQQFYTGAIMGIGTI